MATGAAARAALVELCAVLEKSELTPALVKRDVYEKLGMFGERSCATLRGKMRHTTAQESHAHWETRCVTRAVQSRTLAPAQARVACIAV